MADSVTTNVMFNGLTKYAARFTNISDATGETLVNKVVLATLPSVPTYTAVEELKWDVQGFTSVRLFWDHTTPVLIDVVSGRGIISYKDVSYLFDPRTAGGTGNIQISTAGAAANATYDITLVLQLRGGKVDF